MEGAAVEGYRCAVQPESERARSLSFEAVRHRLPSGREREKEEGRVASWQGAELAERAFAPMLIGLPPTLDAAELDGL